MVTIRAIPSFFCAMPVLAPCAKTSGERLAAAPGEAVKPAPGALPMFKAAAKPLSAEGVGKYAIKFNWNDGHDLGIYSWTFLREVCPCAECKAERGKRDSRRDGRLARPGGDARRSDRRSRF